ncbi:DNA primase [Frigidibacter oleivorans]|uniref:DNA primase n=1 Tax=Frigidibacter oleivorans TaxID=2487129 RepID=UPI000F8DAFD2|nr:DNA primase [Frigidibacter oleivorans]
MSLPPGFLDDLRNRTVLSRVVGRKVIWDNRKSNQAKGDWWAPCPFHQEKSASFHVDDRKGFYYCFGCHAKGDALTFLRETENIGFMEAVESLAREAGMTMPARDPQAAQRADRRTELVAVMEEAVKWYRLQLRTSAAAGARDYLDRRKLGPDGQERFGIGFAPDDRQGLFRAMTAKGVAPELLVDAGLCARPEDGGAPYDRFRGRIIFPIRDARGRAISLGGRSMDPNARAKYLNGPETEIFDKGRNLYNQAPAREAVAKGAPLLVAEGYMDVIALSEAGFGGAVAPLGTAITEDQLRLLWRIAPEPLVALDGDKAGLRAAMRLIDLALPLIEAGQGLRFVILPQGMDPDDLIRAQGPAAMQAQIDRARPMVDLLWSRETEGRVLDSPERRAALDKDLRAVIQRIRDPSIRAHYAEEIRRLRGRLFGGGDQRGPAPRAGRWQGGPGAGFGSGGGAGFRPGGGWRAQGPVLPLASTRMSLLAAAGPEIEEVLREALILAICARHPSCIARFESQIEMLVLTGEGHDRLRRALLAHGHAPGPDFAKRILADAGGVLETVLALPHVSIAPPVRNTDDSDLAGLCLAEELAKLEARRGARAEIEDAMEDLAGLADEGVTWRLNQAAEARHRAERPQLEDADDLGEDRAALSAELQALIDGEVWRKKRN